jgi:hypothetical protein
MKTRLLEEVLREIARDYRGKSGCDALLDLIGRPVVSQLPVLEASSITSCLAEHHPPNEAILIHGVRIYLGYASAVGEERLVYFWWGGKTPKHHLAGLFIYRPGFKTCASCNTALPQKAPKGWKSFWGGLYRKIDLSIRLNE